MGRLCCTDWRGSPRIRAEARAIRAKMRKAGSARMTDPIGLRETTDSALSRGGVRDSAGLRLDPSRRIMLRFQVSLDGEDEMEALRYARRMMIREERTRGLEWDEPSMEDPTLSGSEIRWFVLAGQAAWGRQKMAELIERANRAVEEIRKSHSPNRYPR